MSSFGQRLDYGLEPLRTAWLLTLLLLRFAFSVALAFAVGQGVVQGVIYAVLPGALGLAVAAAITTFYMMMSTWFADRGLSWVRSGALRVALLIVFLLTMLATRVALESVAMGLYPQLELLIDYPEVWRVPVAYLAGLLTMLTVARLVLGPQIAAADRQGPNPDESVRRGPCFRLYAWVRNFYVRLCGTGPYVNFLWVPVPLRLARKGGILFMGSPGEGKTVALQDTIFSFLDQAARAPGPKFTAFITDVANELWPILQARYANSGIPFYHILPFHRPALALDIASLPKSMMSQVSKAVFPSPAMGANGTDSFFYRTLLGITTAGLNGFKVRYGSEFSLAMFFKKMSTAKGMIEAINWDADNITNITAVSTFLQSADPKLSANVVATFAAAASEFHDVFAAMHHQWAAGQRFNFSQLEHGGVCVVGWDSNRNTQMAAWHGLLFRLLKWNTLARPETTSRHMLVVLDELATVAGPIASSGEKELEAFIREGRKRGAVVCLAAHSRSSLASMVGGLESADAILGLPRFFGAFTVGDPDTASWCARRLSGEGTEVERTVTTFTTASSQPNAEPQKSTHVLREMKQLVSPAQLLGREEGEAFETDLNVEGEDILAFGKTHWGDVFRVRYEFAALKRDYPRPQPFALDAFSETELELRIGEPEEQPSGPVGGDTSPTGAADAELRAELQRYVEAELAASDGEDSSTPRKRKRRRSRPVVEAAVADDDGLPYEDIR